MYIGYSDHTKPDSEYDVIEIAYLLGAQLIEKHFTLDKSLAGMIITMPWMSMMQKKS